MRPSFQNIFIVPRTYEPQIYEGTLDDNNWNNGVLRTADKRHVYAVLNGIPNFVAPSVEAWTEEEMEEVRKGNWIERNWRSQTAKMRESKSRRVEFCRRIAESDGIVLDVASGPGGGTVPGILHFNPEAKVLMNDLGIRVLQEWQAFLRGSQIRSNVGFAAFDATCTPIRSGVFDAVTSSGGFGNIPGTDKALQEASRVLKLGGTLFMADGTLKEEDFSKFPKEVQSKWNARFPSSIGGYRGMLRDAGLSITSYEEVGVGTISPDESELGKLAARHGISLRFVGCYVEAEKRCESR